MTNSNSTVEPDKMFSCHAWLSREQCAECGRLSCVCSRVAQRVLRYGDMEYVMLHLIFIYLTPGEGQPAAYAASDLSFQRDSSGGPLSTCPF